MLCRSYRDRTGKNLSAWESLRPLVPICLQFLSFLLWAHNSSYNILGRQPRLMYLACGTVFSNIAVSTESWTLCEVRVDFTLGHDVAEFGAKAPLNANCKVLTSITNGIARKGEA